TSGSSMREGGARAPGKRHIPCRKADVGSWSFTNQGGRMKMGRRITGLLTGLTVLATAPLARAQDMGHTKAEVYGFAMLDMGYQTKQNDPLWFDVLRPTKLPSVDDQFGKDGRWFSSVRQSRFGIKTTTPTERGDLKTQFEFEMFGVGVDAGQTTIRLRHAYGELGKFGAGQTWSPFMDIDVFPNSVEYWGPNGMVFFRNVQARWAPIQNDRLRLIFAAERPGASADGGLYADRVELQGVKPKFDMPDFSWQVRVMRPWGHVQVAGIFRKISWVNTAPNPPVDLGGDALGWGINVASNINFTKKDVGRFAVV